MLPCSFPTSDVCTSAEPGAYCTVVDVILTVYSATNATSAAAEQQAYDQVLVMPVEAGTYVSGDILAIRFHPTQHFPADSLAVIRGGNPQTPTDGNQDSSMFQTILISVMILVGVAVLVAGLVLYRKRVSKQPGSSSSSDGVDGEDDFNSDSSSNVADHGAVPVVPTTATEDSPHCV